MTEFTLEEDVDRYVMQQLESLGLKQHSDYHIESEMDPRLKEALKGGAKTKQHSTFGKPDLNITIYNTPVLFENKLNPNDFVKRNSKGEITHSDRDIKKCAVNGGLHYARVVLDSKKYDSCVVVATAGRDSNHLKQEVYYVYAVTGEPKHVEKHDNLKFLANKDAFDQFILIRQSVCTGQIDVFKIIYRNFLTFLLDHVTIIMQSNITNINLITT